MRRVIPRAISYVAHWLVIGPYSQRVEQRDKTLPLLADIIEEKREAIARNVLREDSRMTDGDRAVQRVSEYSELVLRNAMKNRDGFRDNLKFIRDFQAAPTPSPSYLAGDDGFSVEDELAAEAELNLKEY